MKVDMQDCHGLTGKEKRGLSGWSERNLERLTKESVSWLPCKWVTIFQDFLQQEKKE